MIFDVVDLSDDDLESTGLAYLQLRRTVESAINLLTEIRIDPDVDLFVRSDILQVILKLREGLD